MKTKRQTPHGFFTKINNQPPARHLNKLTKVLSRLSKAQLTRLKKYLHSPYFAVYPPAVKLFDYLAPLHPAFLPHQVNIQSISAKGTGLATLQRQVAAGTRLLRAIENFLAQEQFNEKDDEITRLQFTGYRQLGLTDEAGKSFSKQMAKLSAHPDENFETLYEKHLLTELSLNGFSAKLNRSLQNDIMRVVKTLDEFHALKKLRYLCEALNRQQVLGAPGTGEPVAALFQMLEPYNHSAHPYAYLFINVYHMLEADTFENSQLHYRLIKQFAERHGPTPAVREAMTYAINSALFWNNKGFDEAGSEYLWWQEWKRKNNLLLENGRLMPITFRNIVTAAFSQKKPQLIQHIITAYAPHLPPGHTDTNLAFANALYHYSARQYKTALRCFMQAQAKDEAIFNSIIRRWQWMCAYECDPADSDTLFNQLASLEKFLHRNQTRLQPVAHLFELFLDYAARLLKTAGTEMPISCLTDLQSCQHFPGKPWLTEQLESKIKKTRAPGARVKLG